MAACATGLKRPLPGSAGQPLDLGRTVRSVTPAQRTALNVRDKGCRHPDCHRPPADCEAHHVIHWLEGNFTITKTPRRFRTLTFG